MLSIKTKKILAVVCFSLAFLITRVPFLGYDEINPDAVNWYYRSEQFIVGLKSKDFIKTYQHYHPGVTLMWIMGVPTEIERQLNPKDRVYNEDNFIKLHQVAKYSLILVQLFLSIVLILGLKEIVGLKKALLGVSIFSMEPFFLGNSRLLHMDALLALFMILTLTFAYLYFIKKSKALVVLAALFAGLSFLTKSVGLLSVGFIAAALIILVIRRGKERKGQIIGLVIFLLISATTIFTLFPALWVNPKFVLSDIYNEGLRVGTRRGHEQVIMGDTTDVAGPDFYPLILAIKTSPLIWFGVGFFIFQIIKNYKKYQKIDRVFLLYTGVFYLIYFLGMTVASKKIDRYMVPIFPMVGLISAISLYEFVKNIRGENNKTLAKILVSLLAGMGILYPLVKYYPYYFTYTNPVFGSSENANKIVGQKPFGIGIPELKNLIVQRYGPNVTLGFIDKKPMSMIYKNSTLYDIRESGTKKYNLIILGPNEVMPDNVIKGEFSFTKDYSMYINGLEYWRIYKKVT